MFYFSVSNLNKYKNSTKVISLLYKLLRCFGKQLRCIQICRYGLFIDKFKQ